MKKCIFVVLVIISLLLSSCVFTVRIPEFSESNNLFPEESISGSTDILSVPEFSGAPYVIINNNTPSFSEEVLSSDCFEEYTSLDSLGRCGVCTAVCGEKLMPDTERESISHIYPSGWVQKYYSFVDGEYLYNRCHLIGWQLTGENANENNLITGTRYMNVSGMLPFENKVADYIKQTGNRVAYRVTPIFTDNNLICNGIQIEAYSIEDDGKGICFNVYCYNVQPGVVIDYATGDSKTAPKPEGDTLQTFILNTKSKKIHLPTCSAVDTIAEHNKDEYKGYLEELTSIGYSPCGICLNDD